VCENNQYAQGTRSDWSIAGGNPAGRAAEYGIPGVEVDGMDFFAVHDAASTLIERARAGDGPSYLVCVSYRYLGHHAGDPLNYRTREEVDLWRQKDPIDRFKRALLDRGVMTGADVAAMEQAVDDQVQAAINFAKASPEPSEDELMTDIDA